LCERLQKGKKGDRSTPLKKELREKKRKPVCGPKRAEERGETRLFGYRSKRKKRERKGDPPPSSFVRRRKGGREEKKEDALPQKEKRKKKKNRFNYFSM